MSVISACSRIKYCIIDNPDIKTSHGPPLAPQSSQSVLELNSEGNIEPVWPGVSAGNLGQEGDSSSEPCALLADGESFAHSHALWFCDRKLPTAGFTAGEILCLVGSRL